MPRVIEKWTPLEGYESLYAISNKGRIKNIRTSRILKGKISGKGYCRANLSKNGQLHTFTVHCLVAKHFIPNPDNLPEVNHINENKLDNRVENLEWCTRSYNVNYGNRTEKQKIKVSKPVRQLSKRGEIIGSYPSIIQAGRENKLSNSCISACCRGLRHTCGGYVWQYDTGGAL